MSGPTGEGGFDEFELGNFDLNYFDAAINEFNAREANNIAFSSFAEQLRTFDEAFYRAYFPPLDLVSMVSLFESTYVPFSRDIPEAFPLPRIFEIAIEVNEPFREAVSRGLRIRDLQRQEETGMSILFDPLTGLTSAPLANFTGGVGTTIGNAVTDPTFLSGLVGIAGQILAQRQASQAQSDAFDQQLRLAQLGFTGGGVAAGAGQAAMQVIGDLVGGAAAGAGSAGTTAILNALGLGSNSTVPAGAIATTGSSRLPQVIRVPTVNRVGMRIEVDYVRRGRPLLYSSDFASARRVRKVASKARARSGVSRRRTTSGLTFCNGCTQPLSRCSCSK